MPGMDPDQILWFAGYQGGILGSAFIIYLQDQNFLSTHIRIPEQAVPAGIKIKFESKADCRKKYQFLNVIKKIKVLNLIMKGLIRI